MASETILIVEDNPANMELATDLLEIAGYEVHQAWDAEAGIETARALSPDLILMDVGLPGMDGLTASAILRNDAATHHINVVVVTAHAMQGDEDKAMAIGCAGYITKPIDTRSFTKTVTSFIQKGSG